MKSIYASWDGGVSHVSFKVTMTLILICDLVFRISVPSIYLKNPKFGVWMHLWMTECHVLFKGYCDLDSDLVFLE